MKEKFKLSKIKNIEILDEKTEMIDLTVPKYENFILANGLITHNCTQTSAKLDVSLLRESDCIIMLKGSLMMEHMERPIIKKLYKQYGCKIDEYTDKVRGKGVCVIYSQTLKAVARFKLPKWYTENISTAYRDKEMEELN